MLRADLAGCAPALRLCRALLTPGTALGTTAWVALRARPPKHWRTSFCAYLAESTKIAGDDADFELAGTHDLVSQFGPTV